MNAANGTMTVEQYIERANDEAKKMYMERIWRMDKDQIFHELCGCMAKALSS